MNNNDDEKLTFQEEIQNLFSTYSHRRLHPKIIERLKEMLKETLTEVISQTCRYSLLRDNFSTTLDQKDLLCAIQKRGTKYKSAIGYSLVKRTAYSSSKGGHQYGVGQQQNNEEEAD